MTLLAQAPALVLVGVIVGALSARGLAWFTARRALRRALDAYALERGYRNADAWAERLNRPPYEGSRATFEFDVRTLARPMIGANGFVDFDWAEWATVIVNVHVSHSRRWPSDRKWEEFERELRAIATVGLSVTIKRRLTRLGAVEGRRA